MACRLLVLGWIAMALPAQDTGSDLRGRVFGEVRDRKGEPWPAAEVVLVSRPLPQNPDVGEEDRIVTTTDAGGRFAGELLRGRPYTVWAWGRVEERGRRSSQVAEGVFVQRPVLLQETGRRTQRVARLTGLERWAPRAPFELRVIDETGNRQVTWLAVADDGRASLPLLLGPSAWIEVFGTSPSGRYPITRMRLDARDAPAGIIIDLPERERIVCWARDSIAWKPCPGATVFRQLGATLHPVGVTDHEGKLQLDVFKLKEGTPDLRTFVLAAGQAFGVCDRVHRGGWGPENTMTPAGAAPSDLYVNLMSGDSLHGRVVGMGDAPVAGLQLWCAGAATNKISASGGGAHCNLERIVTTDERGEFVVDGVPDRRPTSVHAVLRERDFAAIPPRWRSGLLPVVYAPLLGQRGEGTKANPLIVDLRAMCPIELTFTDPEGAPAADVELSFSCLGASVQPPWGWSHALADQRGTLRILVPGDGRLGFRAVRGLAMLIRALETGAGRVAAGPAPARFRLPAPTAILGRLLHASGEPASGVKLQPSSGVSNTPAEWQYRGHGDDLLADRRRNALRIFVPDEPKEALQLTHLINRETSTDDAGNFAIPMPLERIPDLLLFTRNDRTWSSEHSIQLSWTGETQKDVVWRLPR